MSAISNCFVSKRNLLAGKGVSVDMIETAEKALNLAFSEEYREYLKEYGIAAYGGHELTGLTKSPRVNVVDVTRIERERNPDVPADYYVIEQTNVEDVVIWQSCSGDIYYSSPNHPLTKLCDSFSEYISK